MITILQGDVRARLAELANESVQCCVTSPPYFGLRDYGTAIWEKPDLSATGRNDERQRALRANLEEYQQDGIAAPDGRTRGADEPHPVKFEECDHRRFNAYSSGLEGGKEAQDAGKLFKDTCAKCGANRIDSQIGLEKTPEEYAHFATFPPDLIKPCILAGSRPGDVILDPFAGSGTTGMVALELGRKATLIELNPDYVKLIEQRCNVTPGLALTSEVAA